MNNLVLFGFRGCGKSYYGKLLSQKLGCKWVDTDERIEQKCCMPLKEVCQKFGEQKFRELESEVIASLKEKNAIISLGGGAVLQKSNVQVLERMGKLVYLKVEKQILSDRFLSNIPVFLEDKDPLCSFEEMYEKRLPLYESVKAIQIPIMKKNDEDVLCILEKLMG